MFLKRTKSGKYRYLQLVEAYREGGRTRQRVVATLGREDQLDRAKLRRLARQLVAWAEGRPDVEPSDVEVASTREVGRLMVLERLWQELELDRILTELWRGRRFEFDAATVVKAIVFGRVIAPSSERALVREWLARVRWPGFEAIRLHHAYRALAALADIQLELERALTRVLTEKLFADVTLTLFDATSIHFEGRGPDGLAAYGYSPTRPDLMQVRLGLLTSRDGLPLSHWVFPGDQSDVVSFTEAAHHFREQLPVASFTVVADRGMVSEANLQTLEQAGIPYIVGVRLRWQAAREALATAGRYRQVRPNLFVKELHRDGHRRVLVCYNPEAAQEDRRQRAEMVAHLAEALRQSPSAWRRYLKGPARRYLVTEGTRPRLNPARIRDDACYDGKWVLWTTSSLPPEEVALAYKGLLEVEASFRTLKTPLEIQPVYHWSEAGVRGHITSAVLALLLARLIERRLEAAGMPRQARTALATLAGIDEVTIELGGRRLVRTTRLTEEQRRIWEALQMPSLPAFRVA